MKFKKILVTLLACILVFNIFAPAAAAVGENSVFTIKGVDTTAEIGSEARVDLEILNNEGFSALNLYYTYNEEYFTLKRVENKDPSLTMTHDKTTVWDTSYNYTANGTLATLVFDVAKDTPFGEYEIGITLLSAANDSLEHVYPVTVNATVTVTPIKVQSIVIYNPSVALDIGAGEQLIAQIFPEDAADKAVTWRSENEKVATVDQNGFVTGASYGNTEIVATTRDGSHTARCKVSVNCSHQYSTQIVEPSYTEHGYTVYTCDICGHVYNDNFVDPLERTPINEAELSLEYTFAYYKGVALEPSVYVSYQGQQLNAKEELSVTYSGNNTAGIATVTVEGINRFTGVTTLTFEIGFEAIPQKIVNVSAVSDYGKILLSWGRSSEVMTKSYNIYRSEDEVSYTLITTVSGRDNTSYEDTTVERGKAYTYYVTGVGDYGAEGEPSNIAGATALADVTPPTILKLSPANNTILAGSVQLSAVAEDNVAVTEGHYYYSLNGEDWKRIGISRREDLSINFKLDFATDITNLTVRLIAYDAEGNASAPKYAEYMVDTMGPEKVTGLTYTPLSSKLTLSWDDVTATDAQYFILQQRINGSWTVVARNITTLGYTITGLSPNTDYYFRVACVDIRENVGTYSDEFKAATSIDTAAPVITEQGPASARLNSALKFYATARDDSDIKYIIIETSDDLSDWQEIDRKEFSEASSKRDYSTNIDLEKYPEGKLFVRAIAEDLSGNRSDTTAAAPYSEYIVDRTAPKAPQNVTANGKNGYVSIFWTMGTEQDISTYSVYRALAQDGEYTRIASSLSAISYHDTAVEAGKEYFYKVTVVDKAGNISEYSLTASASMSDDTQKPVINSISSTAGQKIGPSLYKISVAATDNNNLDSLLVEYCTSKDLEYKTLHLTENIGKAYLNQEITLPIEDLADGDALHIRVSAIDMAGLSSGYSMAKYTFDSTAPESRDFAVTIEGDKATLTWKDNGDSDLSGFRIYRSEDQKSYSLLGSRAANSEGNYTFSDTLTKKASTTYYYKLETLDNLQNATASVVETQYTYVYENTPPTAKISIPSYIMAGVEEVFDASLSTDDIAITEYLWDFGDGTNSTDKKAVKKYAEEGDYTVTLTVTDNGGMSATATTEINVQKRETLGVLKVSVLDENKNPVPYAPVYFDLGSENQRIVNTDGNGVATMKLSGGTHLIGMYTTGYLPVKKEVVVLENATRDVTLTTVKEDIVTGEFEITRMTFDEIVAAGIDVYDPANRNVYSATVRVYYGSTPPMDIQYVRNDSKILDFKIFDINGKPTNEYKTETGESRSIVGVNYIGGGGGSTGGDTGEDVIAIIDIPAEASYLKEFFDVKLHIINNASPEFTLEKNLVTLNVPEGMTLMDSVSGGYLTSNIAQIDSIKGQETKTLAWVLRGDEAGEYNLSADFTGTLALFNATINTRFETTTPIKVYGLEGVTFRILTADKIYNETLYFNIELENNRDIDIYAPAGGLTGKIKNVTESVLNKQTDKDFYVESYILNVYLEDENGFRQYVPYSFDSNLNAIVSVDVLAPGQKIVYEYVAYNAIDYDGIAYFKEAVVKESQGLAKNIETGSFQKQRYSFIDYSDKLDAVLSGENNETVNGYKHLLDSDDYYYVSSTNGYHAKQIEKLYKNANIILNLDFSDLTQEEEREMIQTIILNILSDSSIVKQSEDLLMVKYSDAVTGMLDKVKDGLKHEYEDDADAISTISTAVADISRDSRELAVIYRTEGSDAFKEELNKRFAGYAIGATVNVFDYLTSGIESSCVSDAFGTVKDTVNRFFNAVGEHEREKYYYALLKHNCDAEVSKTILYALHDVFLNQLDDELLNAIKDNLLPSTANIMGLPDVGLGANLLAYQTVEKMIHQLETDMDEYYNKIDLIVQGLEEVVDVAAQAAIKAVFATALSSTPYALISAGFNIADAIFGFGDYIKQQDTFEIYKAMSHAFLTTHLNSIKTRDPNADFYSMLYLRALCEMRLSGEAQYKKFMGDYINGVYFQPVDEDIILFYVNLIKDTDYTSFDKWGDELQYSIVRPRDLIFNIENTELNIPRAPVVSLNYETLLTEQSFSAEYEYCFADGVWKDCDGGQIPFTVGSVPSVLRVRKATGENNLAGQITTVKIFAQKELSKLINVKFDGVNYIFSNLLPDYQYQVIFTDDAEATPDWSKAKLIFGSDSVIKGIAKTEYAVIRSSHNVTKGETASKPLVLSVADKKPLDLIIDGNGTVTQSGSDGCYFNGEDIDLIATAAEGEEFLGWYVNGAFVSNDNYYVAEMADNLQITARFGGKKIVGVSITNPPKKITYYEGEHIDLNGLELTVSYGDETPVTYSLRSTAVGTSQSIAEQYTAYFASNTAGESQIIINYGGHIATFDVEIIHDTTEYVKQDATCGEDGIMAHYCTLCNSVVKQEAIAATGDHEFEWVTDKDATCGEDGIKHEECTVCDTVRNENTPIDATGNHEFEWVTDKDATCGENGVKHEECTVCDAVRNENTPIDATGDHNFEWVTDKDATCGENGIKHEECTVCDAVRSENTPIDATGDHNFEWVVDKHENCGVAGIKHEECSVCHTKQNENTPILATGNHTYSNACDKDCNVCGEVRAVPDHVYDNACDTDCNICGDTRTVTHDYKNSELDDNYHWLECDCGAVLEKIDHKYDILKKDENEHWNECICGKQEFEYRFGHGYSKVFDQNEHWLECECGAFVEKEPHNFDSYESSDTSHWLTCLCGAKNIAEDHKYTHAADTTCNICNAEREVTGAMLVEEDGNKAYYLDGVFQSETTDLIKIDGTWYYIKDGVWDTSIDTLHKINGKWFLVKGGIWNKTTGLEEYKGKIFYVQGGKWDSTVNELKKLDGKWYFIKSGKWDKTLDSLHKLNGKWFLVKKGMWTATTGLVEYKGKQFYVKGGKWESRNDIVKIGSKYYFIKGGKWDKTITTLFKKDGKLYAVKKGMWYKSKAIIKYSGKKYYVNNGYAQTKFSGKVTISGKKYTVKKGIIK